MNAKAFVLAIILLASSISLAIQPRTDAVALTPPPADTIKILFSSFFSYL
ncbi:MAG: hypothetical protein J7K61_00050 [Thermoplasmata archaeon]|nr:hypothetical protein [Thermoplasmata archaeon]